mmetsp:Transcript_5849/g.18315  ORF Transcript_5849/g.18315 Transcript_5849/m.18315 type:complete len:514 (+) Transcript_5849:2151-3692(+)
MRCPRRPSTPRRQRAPCARLGAPPSSSTLRPWRPRASPATRRPPTTGWTRARRRRRELPPRPSPPRTSPLTATRLPRNRRQTRVRLWDRRCQLPQTLPASRSTSPPSSASRSTRPSRLPCHTRPRQRLSRGSTSSWPRWVGRVQSPATSSPAARDHWLPAALLPTPSSPPSRSLQPSASRRTTPIRCAPRCLGRQTRQQSKMRLRPLVVWTRVPSCSIARHSKRSTHAQPPTRPMVSPSWARSWAVYPAISNSGKCQTPKGADGMAVKLLKLDAKNALAVAREVEILKQANHSNIVGYYDYFLRPGPDGNEPRLWLFLEFCALGSVLDVMEGQGGPLNEAQAAVVLREVLTALDYMHNELRALHRDVKAANVLLTRTGKVKLGDLGVAAQVYNTMQMRGTMIGTPHWMAPEAFGSVTAIDVSTYDNKVDVWGVGITAIELATMKPPNSELSSVFDIILAIVNGPPPSLSPECGDVLASFVAAALVKDPSARPDAGTLLIAPIIERGAPAIAPL